MAGFVLTLALTATGCAGSESTVDGEPGPRSTVDLPSSMAPPAPELAEIGRAVVRVDASGCGPDTVGSAFLVGDRRLITAAHVVSSATAITLTFEDGKVTDADLLGIEPELDLAMLRAGDSPAELPAIEIAPALPTVGAPVIAIGYPIGLPQSVSQGTVSALHEPNAVDSDDPRPLIQTDTALNPGNSGGPLLNDSGRAVGVVSTRFEGADGIGMAVALGGLDGLIENWVARTTAMPPMGCGPLGLSSGRDVMDAYLDAMTRGDLVSLRELTSNDRGLALANFAEGDNELGTCRYGPDMVLCEILSTYGVGSRAAIGIVLNLESLQVEASFYALTIGGQGLDFVDDVWRGDPNDLAAAVLDAFAAGQLRSMNRWAPGIVFGSDDLIGGEGYLGTSTSLSQCTRSDGQPADQYDRLLECWFVDSGLQVELDLLYLPDLEGWIIAGAGGFVH